MTTRSDRGLRPRRLLVGVSALAALAAPLATATAAHADTSGTVGSYQEAGVTCYLDPANPQNNRVIVQGPEMSSSPTADSSTFYVGGGMFGGGFHPQRVGYQANLYQWDGTQWVPAVAGDMLAGQTQDALQPVGWDSTGATWFATPGSGDYAVYMQYYWYGADGQTIDGWQADWAQVYEQGRATDCHF